MYPPVATKLSRRTTYKTIINGVIEPPNVSTMLGFRLHVARNYANYTIQNSTLLTRAVERLRKPGVKMVPNASVLNMWLLRHVVVPIGMVTQPHALGAFLQLEVDSLVCEQPPLVFSGLIIPREPGTRIGVFGQNLYSGLRGTETFDCTFSFGIRATRIFEPLEPFC